MKNGKTQIKEGIKILWHSGYYDGPISGIADLNGEKVFFNMKREYATKKLYQQLFRSYNLYKMTPEQWEEILYWHNEFRLFVGTHCDYTYNDEQERLTRSAGDVNKGVSHEYMVEMYYDRHKEHEVKNGKVTDAITKPENLVGWCIYDVLLGKPWKAW